VAADKFMGQMHGYRDFSPSSERGSFKDKNDDGNESSEIERVSNN